MREQEKGEVREHGQSALYTCMEASSWNPLVCAISIRQWNNDDVKEFLKPWSVWDVAFDLK